ncbi:MAG: SRPBCC family protein [Dehalococcoidales bacterium]|nr:SRPBCC family protein [Dehalococcoidales bacterium]
MPTIKVEFTADVKAKAERLWDILTDVSSWPQWLKTTYVKQDISGPLAEGATFTAELGGIRWNLTIIKAKKPELIRWKGRRFGIEAIHEWEFIEDGENTRIVTRESMTGWIAILTYPVTKPRLSKYDEKWLAGLKTKAESL